MSAGIAIEGVAVTVTVTTLVTATVTVALRPQAGALGDGNAGATGVLNVGFMTGCEDGVGLIASKVVDDFTGSASAGGGGV